MRYCLLESREIYADIEKPRSDLLVLKLKQTRKLSWGVDAGPSNPPTTAPSPSSQHPPLPGWTAILPPIHFSITTATILHRLQHIDSTSILHLSHLWSCCVRFSIDPGCQWFPFKCFFFFHWGLHWLLIRNKELRATSSVLLPFRNQTSTDGSYLRLQSHLRVCMRDKGNLLATGCREAPSSQQHSSASNSVEQIRWSQEEAASYKLSTSDTVQPVTPSQVRYPKSPPEANTSLQLSTVIHVRRRHAERWPRIEPTCQRW